MIKRTQHFQHYALRGKMTFFAPDDGSGSGAATALGDVETEVETPEHTPAEGVVETDPDKGATVTPAFDPNKFASEFGSSFGESFAKNQPKPETPKKDLSPEEAARLLNVWQPDDAFFSRFDNLETRKAAFNEMRDSLIKQADTVAQIRLQQQLEQINQQYAPIRESIARQETEAQNKRFSDSYPQIGKPELQPMIASVMQGIVGEIKGGTRKPFSNEGDAFKEVASRVEKIIQVHNPNFKLSAGETPSKKSGGEIPVTSPGAGGGGGGGAVAAPKGSKALSVLGNVGG